MGEVMLSNILDWCYKNTNILKAKDDENIGKSFIHFASENGYTPVVADLLTNELDINVEDKAQCTPLHLASKKGHTEIVKLLIQYGAAVNCKSNSKLTSLQIASYNGHKEVA